MGLIPSTLNQPEQWRVWSNMGLEFILAEPGSATRIFWDDLKQHSQAEQSPQTQKIGGGQAAQAQPVASAAQNSGQTPAQAPAQTRFRHHRDGTAGAA